MQTGEKQYLFQRAKHLLPVGDLLFVRLGDFLLDDGHPDLAALDGHLLRGQLLRLGRPTHEREELRPHLSFTVLHHQTKRNSSRQRDAETVSRFTKLSLADLIVRILPARLRISRLKGS